MSLRKNLFKAALVAACAAAVTACSKKEEPKQIEPPKSIAEQMNERSKAVSPEHKAKVISFAADEVDGYFGDAYVCAEMPFDVNPVIEAGMVRAVKMNKDEVAKLHQGLIDQGMTAGVFVAEDQMGRYAYLEYDLPPEKITSKSLSEIYVKLKSANRYWRGTEPTIKDIVSDEGFLEVPVGACVTLPKNRQEAIELGKIHHSVPDGETIKHFVVFAGENLQAIQTTLLGVYGQLFPELQTKLPSLVQSVEPFGILRQRGYSESYPNSARKAGMVSTSEQGFGYYLVVSEDKDGNMAMFYPNSNPGKVESSATEAEQGQQTATVESAPR